MSRSEAQKQADKRYEASGGSPNGQLLLRLSDERRAVLAAIQKPGETHQQVIYRLIDKARPRDLDLGDPV